MIVGVISDTHGLLRPEAVDYLSDSDMILHAGDIGTPDIIGELEKICPVTAIRGNIDRGPWADSYPETETIRAKGRLIHMIHNVKELDLDPVADGFDMVVSGHSHKPSINRIDEVIYLNPGSAGPRRFSLPISLGKVFIDNGQISVDLHDVSPSP